jgi:hypothetical protein
MKDEFVCESRATALTALDAITESLPVGAQRQALSAIRTWIEGNTQPMQTWGETCARLEEIFRGSPAEQKGQDWHKQIIAGETSEPEDGAEWRCAWNAQTKQWEPILSWQ